MYIYNVTVKIETHRADEWLTWMREKHIPDVMATGYFQDHRICRLIDEGDLDGVTFVVQYTFEIIDDFLTYQLAAAPSLQREHSEKFGNDFLAVRTLMEVI